MLIVSAKPSFAAGPEPVQRRWGYTFLDHLEVNAAGELLYFIVVTYPRIMSLHFRRR